MNASREHWAASDEAARQQQAEAEGWAYGRERRPGDMQGWRVVAVAAAHPVERSTEEEVELVRHGAHIHVAQSLVREASAEQRVDDHR